MASLVGVRSSRKVGSVTRRHQPSRPGMGPVSGPTVSSATSHGRQRRGAIPGAPRDAFFARGLLGQYVVVIPSARLVVARFGVSHGPGADIDGVGHLIADVIGALSDHS